MYFNASFEWLMRQKRPQILGRTFWELAPATVGTALESQLRTAMTEQRPMILEDFYAPLGLWLEVRAISTPETLTICSRDGSRCRCDTTCGSYRIVNTLTRKD